MVDLRSYRNPDLDLILTFEVVATSKNVLTTQAKCILCCIHTALDVQIHAYTHRKWKLHKSD